ncbi:hypothetical protein BDN70DRAFT_991673 [Pholiota conissans]|uniref:Uncharacterized protein n=1 Tax=Pholiota conissans TaxID=109636 RepID=A0A9P5Z9C3_9AGAR|nr:hypothetical protein BDN70DRAFT_991673 [Pholiota conissans]
MLQTRRRTLNAEELEPDLLYAVLTYRGELASCRLFQGARIGPPNGFSRLTWPKGSRKVEVDWVFRLEVDWLLSAKVVKCRAARDTKAHRSSAVFCCCFLRRFSSTVRISPPESCRRECTGHEFRQDLHSLRFQERDLCPQWFFLCTGRLSLPRLLPPVATHATSVSIPHAAQYTVVASKKDQVDRLPLAFYGST